jgi:hypothetical protein
MDVLVMLKEMPGQSPVLAQVNSVPPEATGESQARDVVTLFGVPNAESLALALAAALESNRATAPVDDPRPVRRSMDVWPERGAVGDAEWLDRSTGEVVKREVEIPLAVLLETAGKLLADCGQGIRRLLTGLLVPAGAEGASRALAFTFAPAASGIALSGESLLDSLREADGAVTDGEDDA